MTQTNIEDTDTVAIPADVKGRKTLGEKGMSLADATGGKLPKAPIAPPTPTPDEVADPMTIREATLDAASEAISGERQAEYGDAQENFERIATIWEAIFGHGVTEAQVALCMAGVKIARLSHSQGHKDSWVDLAGYAALGSEVSK